MAPRRFLAGDPLRALAALSVLVFHAAIYARGKTLPRVSAEDTYGETAAAVFGRLNQGVLVFFVLSGYLISRPFIRALIAGEPLPDVRRYARNRLLRIVPLFVVFVAVGLLLNGRLGASPGDLLAILGFAQVFDQSLLSETAFPHAWTLDAEMAFYLAVPLIALGMAALRGRTAAIVAGCVAVALFSVYLRSQAKVGGPEYPWLLGAPFAPGVLLAVAEVHWAERLKGLAHGPVIAVGLLLLGLIGLGLVPPFLEPELGRLTRPLSAGLVIGAALLLEWSRGRTWKVLDTGVMRWLGKRSYGIYLFHVLVFLELAADAGGRPARLAVMLGIGLPVTLLAADLGHRLVELPALRLKRAPRVRGAPAVP